MTTSTGELFLNRSQGRPASAAAEKVTCAHCGLPVPPALQEEDKLSFCCGGCRTVYEVIHASGFEAYYRLRDETPGQAAPEVFRRFEELDDPAFIEQRTRALPDGLRAVELYLEGVHCSACLWLIEKSLTQVQGVGEAKLDFGRARLELVWRPEEVPLSEVARHLARLGYVPHPAQAGTSRAQDRETRQLLVRIGLAGAVAGNVMLMAFALYGGWLSGMEDEYRRLFRGLSLLVSLPSIIYSGWPFYRSAWNGLKARVLHMDLPISIGILVGFVGGLVNTLRDQGEIYFDSVTALIFLLLVGRLLQLRQQRRATESSELLYALTPSSAERLDKTGQAQRVPLDAIRIGDRLAVASGTMVPTDGIVQTGASSVDQSLLTGESVPVPVRRDDALWGGTTNLEADLVMVATQSVRESRVAQIAGMVESAHAGRAPIVQLADRVAGYFVATVVLLAMATLVLWSFLAPAEAIDHAVALLIVSCPCALGLATPLAITAAIGKAARRGILVRSGAALEALGASASGTLFFDKTGTLTEGRMTLARFEGPDWVKPLIVAAERSSGHPVGRAIRAALRDDGNDLTADTVETVTGGGLVAKVNGRSVLVGSPAFVSERTGSSPLFSERTAAWAEEAMTPVWVAVDGRVVAALALADSLRSDAASSLQTLRALGFSVSILSGDHPDVVEAVGRRLGLAPEQCLGGLSPEDKLDRVQAAVSAGGEEDLVVMVGDGVNDAAALAASTVGVSVHGGAETCFQAADVFLQNPGVDALVDLVVGARRTYRGIRGNIIFSLGYNVAGAGLAISGALNPLLAAVLMPLSSLVVVSNSFRMSFGRSQR